MKVEADKHEALGIARQDPVASAGGWSASQSLKRRATVGPRLGEAEARHLSRSGLCTEGPIPLGRANWMSLFN